MQKAILWLTIKDKVKINNKFHVNVCETVRCENCTQMAYTSFFKLE